MSYWDGTRWLAEAPAPPRSPSRSGRFGGAALEASLITVLAFGLIAGSALAAKGGHGNHNTVAAAACTVDGNVVSATGLPTGEVLNFMVSDASRTWGWVLGFTDTGSWAETVPARAGATTYEFASRTWGPNGSRYNVFARCTAG